MNTDRPASGGRPDEMPHDERLRELYRELPPEEPHERLDEAILSAARRRRSSMTRLEVMRRVRWGLSLAAAAGVVLAVVMTRQAPEQSAPVLSASHPERREQPMALDESASAAGAVREQPPASPLKQSADRSAAMSARPRADLGAKQSADRSAAMSARPRADLGAKPSAEPSTERSAEPSRSRAGEAWPFGLEPNLSEQEACRRVSAALGRACTFGDDVAVIDVDPPAVIDRGHAAGKTVSRLTLKLRDRRLHSISIRFADASAEEVLVAPE